MRLKFMSPKKTPLQNSACPAHPRPWQDFSKDLEEHVKFFGCVSYSLEHVVSGCCPDAALRVLGCAPCFAEMPTAAAAPTLRCGTRAR